MVNQVHEFRVSLKIEPARCKMWQLFRFAVHTERKQQKQQ